MSLSSLPTEMVWSILDHIPHCEILNTCKNLSLLNKTWHQSRIILRKINLRIRTPNQGSDADADLFNELFSIMVVTKRQYVNVEFFYVNFEVPFARSFLFFLVTRFQESIRCLKLTACEGLFRIDLLSLLRMTRRMKELHIHSRIECDGGSVEQFQLTDLRVVSIKVPNDELYQDVCWLAPNLEEFSVTTVKYNVSPIVSFNAPTIARFSQQLRKLVIKWNCLVNNEYFCRLDCTKLVELYLEHRELSGLTRFISKLGSLRKLHLDGALTDEVILAISTLHRLQSLSLMETPNNPWMVRIFNDLLNLRQLRVQGRWDYSWEDLRLPRLRELQLCGIGRDFMSFIKASHITSLILHDMYLAEHLDNILGEIFRYLPHLERLELAHWCDLSDDHLRNINLLPKLTELKLWCLDVSNNLFRQWDSLPLEKLFIYGSNSNLCGCMLADMEKRLPRLKQAVFCQCKSIPDRAVHALQTRIPSCEVLHIGGGDVLPPSLRHETKIYQITAEFPYGVVLKEHYDSLSRTICWTRHFECHKCAVYNPAVQLPQPSIQTT